MRWISLFTIALFLCVNCSKKTEENASVPATQPRIPESIESAAAELEKELTEEDFQKGKNILGIAMKSLSSGKMVKFSDYKGKKLIVDFWSSWCIPCIEMFPDIEKIKKDLEEGTGTVKVLSISVDPLAENARKIMKKQGISFEVLQAPESLQAAGILLPYTVFTDDNGTIVTTTNGKHSYAEIKKLAGIP